MDPEDTKGADSSPEQRIGDLEDRIRDLEGRLARYETVSVSAPPARQVPPPEGASLAVIVCRNHEPFGEVVIANGDWSASPGVPGPVQSEIVLAYCRNTALVGTATIGGDVYAWKVKCNLPPP
jgi:hypothetical protein